MKCPSCQHTIIEKNANFCSACGHRLHVQTPNLAADVLSQPRSLKADLESVADRPKSEENSPTAKSDESSKVPKRVNEDNQFLSRKKKKRKKKSKKKKENIFTGKDLVQMPDPSEISLQDKEDDKTQTAQVSDSESSESAADESPDSLQAGQFSFESQQTSAAANGSVAPPQQTGVAQSVAQDGDVELTVATGSLQSQRSAQNEQPRLPLDTTTQELMSKGSPDTGSQTGSVTAADITEAQDPKGEKQTKEALNVSEQSKLAKNTGLDQTAKQAAKLKEEGEDAGHDKEQNRVVPAGMKMVFGPPAAPIVHDSSGSSVDPPASADNAEVQQAETRQSLRNKTTHESRPKEKGNEQKNEEKKDGNAKQKTKSRSLSRGRNTAPCERFTIYFHAVLSKDFKLNPNEDKVFIRAGGRLGNWSENLVEMFISRDLGEHGFLIEGRTMATKDVTAVSIPYKYIVQRGKKNRPDFEYIYKHDRHDSANLTNRCLFVKAHLLNQDGDWHQYDDIICAEPSKSVLKQLKEAFWPTQRKSLIEGRHLAGTLMLENIFDLLSSWSDINVSSFLIQLKQFFEVYGNPFVYEDMERKWHSLQYDEDNVRQLIKEFMLKNVTPQLSKGGEVNSRYIQDPLRAAVIMLCVSQQHTIRLTDEEYLRLCKALCLPDKNKDDFLQYWAHLSQDISILKKLPDMLESVINTVKIKAKPHWILVLPLLHLLKGTTKPFERPALVGPMDRRTWAGLKTIHLTDIPYMRSEDRKAFLNLLTKHSHLLEVDAFVERSCLFLMPIDDLVDYCVFMKTNLYDILFVSNIKVPQEITESNFQAVSEILSHIQMNLIEEKYSYFSGTYGKECLESAVKLLAKICGGVKLSYLNKDHTGIPVACMHVVASVCNFVYHNTMQMAVDEDKQQPQYLREGISQAMSTMRSWISRVFRYPLFKTGVTSWFSTDVSWSEIEMWNNIISVEFKEEDHTNEWRQKFSSDFEGKYKKVSAVEQIEFYCSKYEELVTSHSHVAAIVERCALEAVPSVCQARNEGKLLQRLKISVKFWKLISAIIQRSWPKDTQGNYKNGEEEVLQHLLSWTAAKDILQLHGTDETLIRSLTTEAGDRLAKGISVFTAINRKLIGGDITINLVQMILKRRTEYLNLMQLDCLRQDSRIKDSWKVNVLLDERQKEVDAVRYEKNLVDVLLTMSHKLKEYMTVDVSDMEAHQQMDIESVHLSSFMEVYALDGLQCEMTGAVTLFNLEADVRDMAKHLLTFKDSYIFSQCWVRQAKVFAASESENEDSDGTDVVDIIATLDVIHTEIFGPSFSKYNEIYISLRDGTMMLDTVKYVFSVYKSNYQRLEKELEIMCKLDRAQDRHWIAGRVQQIQQYHNLHLAVSAAKVIMKVKKTLCLQGDFNVLEMLVKVNTVDFQKKPLSCIDTNVMQAKMVLDDITEPRKLCLQELELRKHFVHWVKDELEDINELKVFVDLAIISAGENDMDVDRVSCFHNAVLGYSSMLYELKPNSGFQVFKDVLKKLWKALENDSNLPMKLRDSARHLDWLKTVKDSHGSVELSSLSLASAINKKGVYLISARDMKKLSLDTAVKLQVLEEHEDGQQIRHYSLEDLRELQNKLMLMSGKGDQGQNEVDHFAEVFSGVQRLAQAFIALHTAGNPLFRYWEAQINCYPSTSLPCITMNFNLNTDFSFVKIQGKVAEHLPELCRKMEKCHFFWKDFVDKQRAEYYYLNYYTAEQILYLCNSVTQQKAECVEDQVLTMLSFVKPNCTVADLRQAWHSLQYEILTQEQKPNEDIEFQTFVIVPESEPEGQDFTSDWDLLPSVVEPGLESQKFDLIWNAYMNDMTGVLPHILDTKRFGQLLEILANKENELSCDLSERGSTKQITRNLPNGLVTGNPNLIVCPHNEILTSCISIYMSSEDEDLPTFDEVLLCTASTTYEQVELFLRRCLTEGYRGQKIYCLLFGDLLTYDVSSKVESFFQRMKMRSRNDYRLVIICSSEREHAYLPSAFSQHRLHMVPQEPLARIRKYLHKHYVVPAKQSSAAAAFKDRLCIGMVSSKRAGVGKSLYVRRLYEKLQHSTKKRKTLKCIRLIEPKVDENVIFQSLLNCTNEETLSIFHFDITSSVQKGLHEFLFKLLILRYLMDSEGKIWRCSDRHLYIIEILQPAETPSRHSTHQAKGSFIDVFPNIFCRAPKEILMLEMRRLDDPWSVDEDNPLMDDAEFRSEAFQRPYQYLARFHNGRDLDAFNYAGVEGSHMECLQMLLMFCGILDPSWAELRNFAWFLNLQLKDCETSVFCDASFTGETLCGFKTFVVNFMILMAKDFATPSLSISDQSPGRQQMNLGDVRDEDLAPFLIRKRWETEPHPYLFFNDDHMSLTFIGFHLELNENGFADAIDPRTRRVIKRNVMTKSLYKGLTLQRVPFNIDFDELPRWEKIERICNVLGVQWPLDPDETYELTTDNILKMLAIHMRFRCGIPVVIMGETGCGKTRLIKFLCELRKGGVATENMKLVKVHGGTTSDMIFSKVGEAEAMSSTNKVDYGFDSVLFFDEANTTEAISSIKEILCDKTVKGESLNPNCGLQIIAACNPYRKHTDEMIQRLESAGLGYRVRAEESDEKLGSIPLRQLVYRVQALPPSMIPLVWDFGQLNDQTEKIYIQQIVQRVVDVSGIDQTYITLVTDVLSVSQKYMRRRKDECSFVSLRDVERCMQAFVWFFKNHPMFFEELELFERDENVDQNERHRSCLAIRDPVHWSLVMAVGVCYHACLENKEKYRQIICKVLPQGFNSMRVMQEISLMQDLLLSGVPLGETIARNNALKENVFMMVICIELKIPLFLVGKPGSSKSLSKTLVADAMQGQAAHSDLYKRLKQIHLVSFQCSPHSTPEGIINTFKQCARFQVGKNLDEYTSVVVLDEIGLAEDSPKMPLKTLHPLLEEGCIDDEPLPHKKVGFIGISNWALDPAKMNRGIFVSRGDPDEKELIESAKGICSSDPMVLEKVRDVFQPFAKAYLRICRKKGKGFFGLRDYYSSVKMIFAVSKASQQEPTAEEIVKAVLRNFSGRDGVNAVEVFTENLRITPNLDNINAIEFIKENINSVGQEDDCRYLLILTKNYAALPILQQTFFSDSGQPEIIFGSSFPKDQEYTQICRNINRVKICMETGQTVVLLNLQNLYESLYDALNQYYVCLGGQKYVDLGLGTHRVKCRVHKDFRLIVIEEKDIVYKQFPIPLINRLEKHYLDIHTVLGTELKGVVDELEKWVEMFVKVNRQQGSATQIHKYLAQDVFIGFHSDTCASVVLQVVEKQKNDMEISDPERTVLDEAKLILLNCATPDSVVRLDFTSLPKVESDHLAQVYFEEQNNSCLADFILSHTSQHAKCNLCFIEMTTFSRLLTAHDLEPLELMSHKIELLSLQQFDTEHSFLKKIRSCLTCDENMDEEAKRCNKILIIQCDFDEGSQNVNLVASAKYSAINEINKTVRESRVFVYFITRLPRMEGGTSYVGFHGGPWTSVHIDDLRKSKDIVSDIKTLQNMSISQMFDESRTQPEAMDIDDMYMDQEQDEGQTTAKNCMESALDTTELVRSCVQSAVGMLRESVDSGFRSTRRVESLLTLLEESDGMKGEFLQAVKRRLHGLLVSHEEHTFMPTNWVMKEASNIDALQEGGTFRQTLWKRVQAVVTPFLAQLISVIDRDCNLDILLDSSSDESLKRLWLDILANDKLLEVPYVTPDHYSETRTILVQNHIVSDRDIGCTMPFSWRIRDHLDELWVYALQQEGQTQNQLDDFFRKTPLGGYISKAEPVMQTEFFQRYLQDFLAMTISINREEDHQLLCCALHCCINDLCSQQSEADEVPSLPWVHTAYYKFKNRIQNLLRMISIQPEVAEVILKNQHALNGQELVLDVYAALACVEFLEPQLLDTDAQRQAWLRQVKKLQVPIELICSEEAVRHYRERGKAMVLRVQSAWNRIFSLSLFVEHLLLGIDQVHKMLTPVVLEHTRRLGQILEKNSDLKTPWPFQAVIGLLRSCKEAAVERIRRFGNQLCPVCMGDPQDPLGLPCGHIFCVACVKEWLTPGQMYCPLCMQPVPDDFSLAPSEELRVLIKQHAQFRKHCNAFFVDLVSSVCFKDNSPPSSEIVFHLLSFLMVEIDPSPLLRAPNRILTKVLSPFDDCVDKYPVVRSAVLKLLLKYSFDEVKLYLQRHLEAVEQNNILDEIDKTELYSMYINCLEDSMFERLQFRSATEKQIYFQDEGSFLSDYLKMNHQPGKAISITYLQQIARVRKDLDLATNILLDNLTNARALEDVQNEVRVFLTSVRNLCSRSGNNWYRIYLIRKICRQRGVDFVQNLLKEDDAQWLFPDEVLNQREEANVMDQYLVCGENYTTIRDAVAKAMLTGKVDGLNDVCEGCKCLPQRRTVYLLLALYREVTTLYRANNANIRPKPKQVQVLENYINTSAVLASQGVKNLAQALVTNNLGPLTAQPGTSGAQCVVLELTLHLAAVLQCGTHPILGPLQQLAINPINMRRAFLPTMPEDMFAVARQALGQVHWYYCPNNHLCTVGECGRPVQHSRCLDCGATIGGINHRPVQGFQPATQNADRTQSGHILGDASRRDNPDMLDTKSLSPVPFNIIRMLTHMAMLLGANSNPQALGDIIKPPVMDPAAFLFNHLLKDIEHVTRSLGKGNDDSVNTLHLVISSLLEQNQAHQWPASYDMPLSTKRHRNGWETEMSSVITRQLKHLDVTLKEANAFIRADQRVSANPIIKLVFGDPHLLLATLPQNSLIHTSVVWNCRERVSLLSLTHIVEQYDGKDALPLLWRFLQKEPELRLVKFLPDILTLQRDLVKRFQNSPDLALGTIADFLNGQKSDPLRALYEKRVKIFLTTWNHLRASLATNGEIKIPADLCQLDLDLDSDLKLLLPQRQGVGLCSTALVSYLIALHNELVYCVDKHTGEETSYKVSPADLTDLHVIRYELERDVVPLLLSNTQYSVERGQETVYEYDLPKIQQQILSRFLLGKPLITLNGIPTLVNRQDRNYEFILKDINAKIQQEPLLTLTLLTLTGELHSHSEVCEALSLLEVALGFLAMTGGEPDMQLAAYLEDVLQMGDQMAPHILKTLSMCCLKHCVALWQLLTSLKSENMLHLKRDPFVEISKEYKVALGDNDRRLLTEFFRKSPADTFVLEMHEFLLLVLKKPDATDTFNPQWSLKDTLVSYIERKDKDVPADVEELFPAEINLCRYVEAWKFIVTFKQERSQRQ